MTSIEELEKLRELLAIEKAEELHQYNTFIKNASIQERVARGMCWYPLLIKETGYGLGDYPYIIAERTNHRDQPHLLQGGKTVSLFSNQPDVQGEVTGVVNYTEQNRIKVIFFTNELPDWVSDGKLGLNLQFDERSYREMEDALKRLVNARNNRWAELREVLLGYQEPEFEETEKVTIPALNDSQNEAVNAILSAKDVAVIHGPPGTGKTTTLVHAIAELSKTVKHILVCAPSNSAADLLTERLDEKGLLVVRIGNLSRIDETIVKHTIEGTMAKHPQVKDIKEYKQRADEFRRMANKYKRNFGKEERNQRKMLLQEARSLAKEAVAIEDYIIDDILSKAQVLTCTLVGSMNRYIENRSFDVVIIDEAAQALEPANWIPVLKADKVVLAGDPYQLPPTVKSAEAQRRGFNKTLLEKCVERMKQVSLLNVQYRMNRVIMGFSNQEFYDNKLIAHQSVKDEMLTVEKNQPLEFIDTAGCGFNESLNKETQSYNNPDEFNILKKHLFNLLEQFGGKNLPSVGIISPYREQVIYMKEEALKDEEFKKYTSININTIDSFQGQERDVIYISLVRSNDAGEIGFLSDYRRMNVAMTRAKKKLVVIGDSATLGGHKFYADFIEYCEKTNSYFSAWEWMV